MKRVTLKDVASVQLNRVLVLKSEMFTPAKPDDEYLSMILITLIPLTVVVR